MRKLISNTEFGKLCKEKLFNDGMTFQWYFEQRNKYDEFLSKGLQLGDFIPCDENGNVLEFDYPQRRAFDDIAQNRFEEQYHQAKSKVIFEGFELVGKNLYKDNKLFWVGFDFGDYTIEDLITSKTSEQHNLTLTDNVKI